MKADGSSRTNQRGEIEHAAPATLEGWSVLHQMFRVRRAALRAIGEGRRGEIFAEAAAALDAIEHREDGSSALFAMLGHKGDLMMLHFRRGLDELARAQNDLAHLGLSEFLEPTGSYLSMVEIGLYEATIAAYSKLAAAGVEAHSPEWRRAIEAELAELRERLAPRLWSAIPDRRYVCFYPMSKRRIGADNWYMLPLEERGRLMHEHGMIGRRYAGKVTQVISGSIGFDDWEWGVDLFADDPMVFKKLVYEMRFDESSARYAEFGPFYVAIRTAPSDIEKIL